MKTFPTIYRDTRMLMRKRVYGNPKISEEKKVKIKSRIKAFSDHHSVSTSNPKGNSIMYTNRDLTST
ncbi:unnamed protein product [Lactuca virosa]|uniref:Uncharacterized protein n=1 Tax=Lactuca virosa TaxID=75947 RepID=A0AAU9P606_9ASTR|nr:unnamed protein product [Lactuca virosa]